MYEKEKKPLLSSSPSLLTPNCFEYPLFGDNADDLYCYAGKTKVTCDLCTLLGNINCPLNYESTEKK